jgi:glutathione S-transferase
LPVLRGGRFPCADQRRHALPQPHDHLVLVDRLRVTVEGVRATEDEGADTVRRLRPEREADPAEIARVTPDFERYAGVLDAHLKGRVYLVGDTLTVADFAVAITLPYAEKAHLPLESFPEIRRWHDRLDQLPAWREPFPELQAA